jgi:hypothetical protein
MHYVTRLLTLYENLQIINSCALFISDDKLHRNLSYMHCWKILKEHPKWTERWKHINAPKPPAKRQKTIAKSSASYPLAFMGAAGGILNTSGKFYKRILDCAWLLIGCHSIPLWSDHDHDLVALFGTLSFESECLLLPADVELDPSCNINHGSNGTQEWPPRNKQCLTTNIHLEYHEIDGYERISYSHRDIFRDSH